MIVPMLNDRFAHTTQKKNYMAIEKEAVIEIECLQYNFNLI